MSSSNLDKYDALGTKGDPPDGPWAEGESGLPADGHWLPLPWNCSRYPRSIADALLWYDWLIEAYQDEARKAGNLLSAWPSDEAIAKGLPKRRRGGGVRTAYRLACHLAETEKDWEQPPTEPRRGFCGLPEDLEAAAEEVKRVREWVQWQMTRADGAETASLRTRAGRKPSVNARMLETIQQDPGAIGWNCPKWAKHLKC